ncbi:MAG: tRNA epoxyqueuosine(34) reductase QueG [Gammaproteobacteria bacterium]|nr:tRNA epoxyqueuosine(34) reductase QueG [Gammaproteobacteria bacterium]
MARLENDSLLRYIIGQAQALGFQQVGVAPIHLLQAEVNFNAWLARGYHGEMAYMVQHGSKRSRPAELIPNTLSVLSLAMNYLSSKGDAQKLLQTPQQAYISRFALGRDYHRLMRKRLQRLAELIYSVYGPFNYRVFVDSAPVLEKPLAVNAGLGWQGKHSNIVSRQYGSWFFLGEIYCDIPLPATGAAVNHCGRCCRCIDVCPTQAIVEPYVVDARRCISYLTIESAAAIPPEFRIAIGNRIFGCDDCQLVCPWNRFATLTTEAGFMVREELDRVKLLTLWQWSEAHFLKRCEGMAIRRVGYRGWLRNIAVALGNALAATVDHTESETIEQALQQRLTVVDSMVAEHISWALQQKK